MFARFNDSRVFDGGSDDVWSFGVTFLFVEVGSTFNSHIVSFGTTCGKDDFIFFGIKELGNLVSSLIEGMSSFASEGMN